jgi:hypothetical protein
MIPGAQPKILLNIDDNNKLVLDETFLEELGKESESNYKLVRQRDQLTKTSAKIKWLEFDETGRYKADFEEIAVGRSLLMSPFSPSFTWQTTPVIDVITETENYIKFATENSVYELFKL